MQQGKTEHNYSVRNFDRLDSELLESLVKLGLRHHIWPDQRMPARLIFKNEQPVGIVQHVDNDIHWLSACADPAFLKLSGHTIGEELARGVMHVSGEKEVIFEKLERSGRRAIARAQRLKKVNKMHLNETSSFQKLVPTGEITPFLKWKKG